MALSDSILYKALRIRLIEERIIDLYPTDLIQSPVHLSIGQEAVAVGICENLKREDWVFINYRGHAFYLAKGGPLGEFFAELMGKVTGLGGGKGGSMHLAAPDYGIMGASAVVASTISHAVGSALASKIRNENNRLFVANFGDGAMEQGSFYESLNFASIHTLPVVFLCEDNELAVHTSKNERQGFDVKKLIESFGIKYFDIQEGFDPRIVAKKSKVAINFARNYQSPVFIRIKTMRYREHVGPGEDLEAGYRSAQALDQWKSNDPLINNPELEAYFEQIKNEIDQAVEFALKSPNPSIVELLTDVL